MSELDLKTMKRWLQGHAVEVIRMGVLSELKPYSDTMYGITIGCCDNLPAECPNGLYVCGYCLTPGNTFTLQTLRKHQKCHCKAAEAVRQGLTAKDPTSMAEALKNAGVSLGATREAQRKEKEFAFVKSILGRAKNALFSADISTPARKDIEARLDNLQATIAGEMGLGTETPVLALSSSSQNSKKRSRTESSLPTSVQNNII